MPQHSRRLQVATAGLIAYAIGVVAVVFTPIGWQLNRLTVWIYYVLGHRPALARVTPEIVGVGLNVLLFIPLGFLLRQLLGTRAALAVAALTSVGIEVVQLLPGLGREASLTDVASNLLGAGVGIALAAWWLGSASLLPLDSSGRYVELDGLRGLAVSGVVLYHYFYLYDVYFSSPVPATVGFSYGFMGVQLFFMISGFVILLTARKSARPRDFVIARGTRLYPTYWLCLTISWVLVAVTAFGPLMRSRAEIAINYTMIQRLIRVREVDGAYWSLSVELIFYGLVFALLLLIGRLDDRAVVWLISGWCAVSLVVAAVAHQHPQSGLMHAVTIATAAQYAPLFGVGMFGLLSRDRGGLHLGALACTALAGVVTFLYDGPLDAAILVGLALLFTGVVTRPSVGLLRWRPLVFIGEISYPLYLLHQNLGYWLIDHLFPRIQRDLASIIAIVLVCCLAWLVHVSVETRLSRQLRRLLQRRFSPRPMVSA